MEQLFKRIVYDTLLAECEKMKTLHQLYKNYDERSAKALYGKLKGYRYNITLNTIKECFHTIRYMDRDFVIDVNNLFKELYVSKSYNVAVLKKCTLEQLKQYQEEIAKDFIHFKMYKLTLYIIT